MSKIEGAIISLAVPLFIGTILYILIREVKVEIKKYRAMGMTRRQAIKTWFYSQDSESSDSIHSKTLSSQWNERNRMYTDSAFRSVPGNAYNKR